MSGAAEFRVALIAVGVLLILHAVRMVASARVAAVSTHARPYEFSYVSPSGDGPRGRLLALVAGLLVVSAARVAAVLGWAPDARDHAIVGARLAAAPRCWVARCVASAAASGTRARRGSVTTGHAPALASLVHGVQLVVEAAATCCAGIVLAWGAGTSAAILAVAIGLSAGAAPRMALARAARRARREAVGHIASTLDVLAAAVAAGLPLQVGLEVAAGHAPPATAGALRGVAARRSTGEDPRLAFTAEAHRFGLSALAEVGEAVDRHLRLGAPLAPELRRIAARVRAEQRATLMETAARRGPLATLVVALVIAPTCLVALTACLIGGLVEGGTLGLR